MTRLLSSARLQMAGLIARRVLWIVAFAFWMGGFSFYGGVVITVGAKIVAGGEGEFGFITQQVTYWLNVSGGVALFVFAGNLWFDRQGLPQWGRRGLAGLWACMVLLHVSLIYIHPLMDALLEPATFTIHQGGRFRKLHVGYITLSTLQWIVAMLFLARTVASWVQRPIEAP